MGCHDCRWFTRRGSASARQIAQHLQPSFGDFLCLFSEPEGARLLGHFLERGMDLKDDVLEFFQFLGRLLLCQKRDSNVAAQFVGNSHASTRLYRKLDVYFLEVAIVRLRCYGGVTSKLIKQMKSQSHAVPHAAREPGPELNLVLWCREPSLAFESTSHYACDA